jgi:MFS family permease
MTFVLAGVVTTLLTIAAHRILREEKKGDGKIFSSAASAPEIGILPSIRLILRSLSFWQIGAVAFFRYGTFVALQGLWLGPYLMEIKGYSPLQTGNLIILLAIGVVMGGPISGRLADRTHCSRKMVALFGLSLYSLSLLPLIGFLKTQSPIWFGLIFFSIGFFSSFGMVIYSHAKELFPISISGTVIAGINFFTVAGAGIFMPALGKIIESFQRPDHSYPPEAYHFTFLICFISMVACLVFYAFSKKEK